MLCDNKKSEVSTKVFSNKNGEILNKKVKFQLIWIFSSKNGIFN